MDILEAGPRRFRLVLADDHEDLLREIQVLLRTEFDILQAVTDGQALIDAACEWKPDAVIADIQMPGVNGIEACHRIVEKGFCNVALILTMHSEMLLVEQALRAGIRGYVLKVDAAEELIPAVRSALGGFLYLSRGVSRKQEVHI
jgi:DNA-binding NarL/FixJ family response regulator